MGEASRINLNLGFMKEPDTGKTARKIPKHPRNLHVTMEQVLYWIRSKDLPQATEDKLIAAAQKTPHGALYNFVHNYRRHL